MRHPAPKAPEPPPSTSRIPVVLLSTREAAEYLNLKKPTLDAMRQQGTGPDYIRVSPRRIAYEITRLDSYMSEHRVIPRTRKSNPSAA